MRMAALATETGRVHLVEEGRSASLCRRKLARGLKPLHLASLAARQQATWCAACYGLGSPGEVAEVSTRFGLPIPPVEVFSA